MDHGGHGDMDMSCSMKMYFNWDIEHVCIVFKWWQINSIVSLVVSCAAVFLISVLYEWLRFYASRYDEKLFKNVNSGAQEELSASQPLLGDGNYISISYSQQLYRSFLYAILVGGAFWLMLVFMTYNGFLMLSVVLGAGTGFFTADAIQMRRRVGRSMACH
ncbi:uncharacterized protein VTP21DRAFT_2650 [Calcarisporiella thermophila]|uniref:uncharacterized protein n=1 Tax=Calcarisporiella thermophila TaxID=911321 RepID=UPI00374413BB